MAAGNWKPYSTAIEKVAKGTLDLDGASFRIVLLADTYTPDQNADATWADLSAAQVTGTGYTAGGLAITQTVTRSGAVTTFDCDDKSWASSTITAKYAAIVRDADANGALASTDDVLAYVDLETGGGSVSTTAGTLSITMNASGLFAFTVS